MAYIKGIFINDIYNNPSNGYTVGLIRVRESSDEDVINKVLTFTGIFDELKYKQVYLMNGNFVTHNKYGKQFQVDTYELVYAIEEELGVSIPDERANEFETVRDAYDFIKAEQSK